LEPVPQHVLHLHESLAALGNITEFILPRLPSSSNRDFYYPSIEDYHDAYVKGVVTPLIVAERILQYLTNQEDHINAVVELNEQDVLQQAKESTERYRLGRHLGSVTITADISVVNNIG
jgi:hypothetical protein